MVTSPDQTLKNLSEADISVKKSQSICCLGDECFLSLKLNKNLCQLYLERIVVYADHTGAIYAIFRVPALQMKDAQLKY